MQQVIWIWLGRYPDPLVDISSRFSRKSFALLALIMRKLYDKVLTSPFSLMNLLAENFGYLVPHTHTHELTHQLTNLPIHPQTQHCQGWRVKVDQCPIENRVNSDAGERRTCIFTLQSHFTLWKKFNENKRFSLQISSISKESTFSFWSGISSAEFMIW